MKQRLGKSELIIQLKNQLEKISDFAAIYDSGKSSYAQDIAVKLRIIFHNSNTSKSLLKQLKLDHIPITDTCKKYNVSNLLSHHWGLIGVQTIVGSGQEGSWKYVAPLDKASEVRQVDFQNWWDLKKVIVDREKRVFTRRKLILELANTDGGAHVDDGLREDYFQLTRENSLGWFQVDKWGRSEALNNPVPPSIRQIAFEVIETFKNLDIEKESKLRT